MPRCLVIRVRFSMRSAILVVSPAWARRGTATSPTSRSYPARPRPDHGVHRAASRPLGPGPTVTAARQSLTASPFPSPRPPMKNTALRKIILSHLICLAAACATAKAQSVDYVYAIEFGQGGGAANNTWNLDQLAVNINAAGVATSYTQTSLVNLTTLVNWDSSGNTHQNQTLNALALDPATNTLFFTYSYNNNSNSANGTFTAQSYALRSTGSGFTATQINTYTEASGQTGTAGVIGSGGAAGSPQVASGWFTKGAFYNGSYYVGIQSSTDNLVQFTLAANENSVTKGTVYTNINHGGPSASTGGDLVISNGTLFMSGETSSGGSTFATETLANALNSSGTAWNSVTSSSTSQYYQLAGLGGISQLFGFASGSSSTFGQFTNFNDPSAGGLTFTTISGSSGVIFADMSDGSNHSIVTPEPATVGVGIFGCVAVLGVAIRRRNSAVA